MPDIQVNVGGVWKTVSGVEVNVGGVWKPCTSIETNVGGVWKQSFTSGIALSLNSVLVNDGGGGTMYAGFYLYRAGTTYERDQYGYYQVHASTDYMATADRTSTIGDLYEMKFVKTSGTSLSGITDNTWYTISATRGGYITTAFAPKSYVGTVHVREIADTSTEVSASVNLNVG